MRKIFWLVIAIMFIGIGGVFAGYIWTNFTMEVEVEEPLEVLDHPSKLTFYPGETKEFDVTIQNHASVNYSVRLDFSLENTTYLRYVECSDEIHTITPGQQNITSWMRIKSDAPPINVTFTVDLRRIEEAGEVLFSDSFDDGDSVGWTEHLGSWSVVNGQYFVSVGGNGISTVDAHNLTDCVIETTMRFKDTGVGFKAGFVFRYTDNEHYYIFVLSDEYDNICLDKHTPERTEYGLHISDVGEGVIEIFENRDYAIKIVLEGDTFTCYLDGEEVLSGIDSDYSIGKVGLWARAAHVYFDDFRITSVS